MTAHLITAAADADTHVLVDLDDAQAALVRAIAEAITGQPGYTPSIYVEDAAAADPGDVANAVRVETPEGGW